jgi:hypothetical protein
MPRRRSVNTLLREQDFDIALECHLHENYDGPLELPSLKTVYAVLCYASIGEGDKVVDSTENPMTAAQVVEEFGLRPFVLLLMKRPRPHRQSLLLGRWPGEVLRPGLLSHRTPKRDDTGHAS